MARYRPEYKPVQDGPYEAPKDYNNLPAGIKKGFPKSMGTSEMYAHTTYDPAHEAVNPQCACTPGNCQCKPECPCMCCWGNGPGGRITNVQYNEKGILEQGMMHLISMGTGAALYEEHDVFLQGIYCESPADEAFEQKAGEY